MKESTQKIAKQNLHMDRMITSSARKAIVPESLELWRAGIRV